MGKDPLCPLGFHPQVRWPTRCKRCFRDYKEHNFSKKEESGNSNLRKDDVTGSAPTLTDSQAETYGRFRQSNSASPAPVSLTQAYNARRNTTGSLTLEEIPPEYETSEYSKVPERSEKEKDYSSIYSSLSGSAISRLNKLRPGLTKDGETIAGSPERRRATASDRISEKLSDRAEDAEKRSKRVQIQGLKEVRSFDTDSTSPDVEFIFEVKKSSTRSMATSSHEDDDELSSWAGTETTETTETTLVEGHVEDLEEQIATLRKDLDAYKIKCDRLEREKGDLLLKKIANYDTRSRNSELSKLQQRIRELETLQEDLVDDKKCAELHVKELEQELERKSQSQDSSKTIEDLRSRLLAAENVIEEFMEENEELKKEMRQMVEEMDEMQDNFREDQADEYRDIKKELEQTAKNCRIIQFKMRKAERRIEQVEAEKIDLENRLQQLQDASSSNGSPSVSQLPAQTNKMAAGSDGSKDRVQVLEHELSLAKELSLQMQKELQTLRDEVRSSDNTGKKEQNLKSGPVLSKSRSLEGTSLRHPEDTTQLIRDLQDSKEREADLREQLKFSEEEAQALRKKLSRVEEENETLVLQLKKMATKKGRRTTPDTSLDKDEGISDDMDDLSLSELKLQLELNEQETSVLRRKVEDMESENERLSREVAELQEKAKVTQNAKPQVVITPPTDHNPNAYYDQKIRSFETEAKDLRLKLIEKDRELERLEGELTVAQKTKGKVVVQRSRSLDNSENHVDLNRKLTVIEQEVAVLRTKITDLETENEKLTSENRRLHLRVSRKPPPTSQEQLLLDKTQLEDQVHSLDKRLAEANQKVAELSAKVASNSPRLGRLAEKGKNLGPNSTSELNVLKREIELMERGLKAKEEELGTVKSQLQAVQTQNTDLQNQMQKLRDAKPLKSRTPKIPSESMTKLQLKKMVEELEIEISDLCPIPGSSTDAEIKDIRELLRKEQVKCTELQNEKTALETKIQQIQRDVRSILPKSSAQAEELQRQLNEASKKCSDLETKLKTTGSGGDFDAVQKIKQEKHRLQKELTEKETKVSDLERKVKDCEDKIKKSERSLKEQKDQLNTIQKELEEETVKVKQADAHHKELSATWHKERDELKKQASDLKAKLEELETTVGQKEKKIKDMDASSREEAKKAVETASRKAEKDMKTAQEEVASVRSKLEEVELKLKQNEQERKALNEKCAKLEADSRREKELWQSKNTDLELELKAEKKKRDRVEKEHDKDLQEKDEEMILMREKVKRAEQDYKSIQEKFESLKNQNTRVAELELELERESQEYEDLTAKYELLEEDYVVIKARLVMDKEQIEEDHIKLKKEHETLEGELRTLRETFNHRQDTWIKEKLDMQEKLKELEEKLNRSSSENWQGERARLKTQLDEKTALLDKAKHEEETLQDQLTNLRKENDEVKRKLEDFDKVTKVQRSMTVDTSAHDKEIRELKNKLAQEEKAHRSEMSHVKLRHDNRLALLNEEVHSYQTHLEKARRERDTFREMLEGAQKMIAELKRDPSHQRVRSDSDAAHNKEMEDNMDKIEEFHARITGLEDELSEARMEISRLKTEAINEKSSWEIRVSEMQTKINEMEEDKVMTTGRSRIPGTKTRLELAWQKERDELQRLLQETSTLARDLRQTLFEVEKERDRERLDAKRKVEQAKKGLEEDQEEMRKKVQELQCDLLELRDAHAKLRTTCEKLRRDKDRSEKEREEMRQHMQDLRRTETDEERKVVRLLDDVQKMKDLCPLVMGAYLAGTRQETKPARETPGDKVREEFLESLRNISRTTEELKRVHRLEETDMSKRSMSFRRAMSSTPDDAASSQTNGNKRHSLYRRTQSLEQNQSIEELESDERGSVDSVSSMGVSTPQPYSKIGSNARYSTLPTRARTVERDQSLDRLSTTSTRSELVPATPETKKKKGLIGKIKQLTKAKSIEETTTADSIVTAGIKALMPGMGDRGSDLSLESRESRSDEKKDKKKIKDKISGFFKKGASSRTNSMERSDSFESYGPGDDPRERRSDSTQRPLARNGSNTNLVAAITPAPAVRTPAIESRTSQSSRTSTTLTKQVSNPKEPEPTPGYAPSMSPLGYSALLSSTGSLPRKTRPVTDRSKTADLRPTLRHQGSQETNV